MTDLYPARFLDPAPIIMDDDGAPVPGAKLYFYDTGTSTPRDTYTDATGATANANPVVCDSAGRMPAIFLSDSPYKVVAKDSDNNTLWTRDPFYPAATFSSNSSTDEISSDARVLVQLPESGGLKRRSVWAAASAFAGLATAPFGQMVGLNISNNAGDANNDIDISAGQAADDTGAAIITLSDSITKRLDAAWSAGTDNGGIDTGSKANDTLYAIWLIAESDGVGDVILSEDFDTPAMPTGYTLKRYLGACFTDGSGNIAACEWYGPHCTIAVPVEDLNTNALGTSRQLITLTAPPNSFAEFNALIFKTAAAPGANICPTSQTDAAPTPSGTPLFNINGNTDGGSAQNTGLTMRVRADDDSQIAARATTTGCTLIVVTTGWNDLKRTYL